MRVIRAGFNSFRRENGLHFGRAQAVRCAVGAALAAGWAEWPIWLSDHRSDAKHVRSHQVVLSTIFERMVPP
jgi:hypothetical protein